MPARVAPLLELRDATVVKGGVRILDHLTFTIGVGEHTAILGPNGAGKSTLINLLTQQDHAFAVDGAPPAVRVLGRDRWHIFDLRAQLGIISNDLHQRFVSGNSAGKIRGADAVVSGFFATQGYLINWDVTDRMREQAAAALARLDATHLSEKPMDEMSTGEARRVLIARALVREPRALILDEPSSGLDVAAKFRFLGTLRRLAQQGITIILITHHVDEIIPEIARVLFLQRGAISRAGTKSELLTSAGLSDLFETQLTVDQRDGYYHAFPANQVDSSVDTKSRKHEN